MALGRDVICLAHVTNTMATDGDDFEKGEADGAHGALDAVGRVVSRLSGAPADAINAPDPPRSASPS
jgi:hypothetical protein